MEVKSVYVVARRGQNKKRERERAKEISQHVHLLSKP